MNEIPLRLVKSSEAVRRVERREIGDVGSRIMDARRKRGQEPYPATKPRSAYRAQGRGRRTRATP